VVVEQVLCALAGHDTIGYRIGVPLVGIACLADAALQLHAPSLLHHVRCLVCSRAQIRGAGKRDVVAGCERLRAHCAGAGGSSFIGMRLDAADVMVPERSLDPVAEGEPGRAPAMPCSAAACTAGEVSPDGELASCGTAAVCGAGSS
jgi:hypothetical protein